MKSLAELRKIRDQVKKDLDMRSGTHRAKIIVCMGTCGIAAGARDTMAALVAALDENGIVDVAISAAGCPGFCEQEPLVEVQMADVDSVRYGKVDAAAAKRIVTEHIIGGNQVAELVFS